MKSPREFLPDLLFVLGAALALVGLWQLSRPLALVACGAGLVLLSLNLARAEAHTSKRPRAPRSPAAGGS